MRLDANALRELREARLRRTVELCFDRLAAEIPALVQQVCMVRPELEFAGPGEIHDRLNNPKTRMVIDERMT